MTGNELLCQLNTKLVGQYSHGEKNIDDVKAQIEARSRAILADIPKENDINKKQAAIIVHEYLLRVLGEEDEKDISRAAILKDLYDCRVCVGHITQVYVKGIIEPQINERESGNTGLPVIFGGNEILSKDESRLIVERTFDKGKRFK